MDNKLSVKDLNVEFTTIKGKAKILRDVSFELKEHEMLGFAGESGCGKTMTSMSIIRLIPPPGKITRGSIIFEEKDLAQNSPREMVDIRGKKISIIFQEPLTALNPCYRVSWQLEEILKLHFPDMDKNERRKRTINILKNVGLSDIKKVLNSYPHQLSGGMRQRIVIAMAIICDPQIMIADEPTTALDVTIQAEILSLIKEIQEERKQLSVIFISHDINLLAERCDRIMIMYLGEILEVADSDDIINKPIHPYTRGLIGSTPRVSLSRKQFDFIKGELPSAYTDIEGCSFYNRCTEKDESCRQQKPELIDIGDGGKQHLVRCFKKK